MHPTIRHRLINLAHSALLFAGIAAIAWFSLSAMLGAAIATIVAAGLVLGLSLAPTAPKRLLLSLYRARPLTDVSFPYGARTIAVLAERADLPTRPALYYIPSAVPNAFAFGNRRDSVICISDGLLRLLSPREFDGVMAHEISHIANRDLWIMGVADLMSRVTSMISYFGQFLLLLNLPLLLAGIVTVPWIVPIVLILAPTITSLLQLALSRSREFDADLGAARLTNDPMALASALAKLERRRGRFWEEIFLPGRRIPEPSLLRTHPPTVQRISRLKQLVDPSADKSPWIGRPDAFVPRSLPTVRRRPVLHWNGSWY